MFEKIVIGTLIAHLSRLINHSNANYDYGFIVHSHTNMTFVFLNILQHLDIDILHVALDPVKGRETSR